MNSLLVTGDKSGVMGIWDLNKCQLVKAVKSHKGSISNIKLNRKTGLITTSGLNDGVIASFDMRSNCGVHRQQVHKGSVNSLKIVEDKGLIISCSADSTIVEEAYDTILAASGKGNLLSFDLYSGEPLYGYGVMKKGACRLLGLNQEKTRVVCAGEDDTAALLIYK